MSLYLCGYLETNPAHRDGTTVLAVRIDLSIKIERLVPILSPLPDLQALVTRAMMGDQSRFHGKILLNSVPFLACRF
jgi:hypothetical protein